MTEKRTRPPRLVQVSFGPTAKSQANKPVRSASSTTLPIFALEAPMRCSAKSRGSLRRHDVPRANHLSARASCPEADGARYSLGGAPWKAHKDKGTLESPAAGTCIPMGALSIVSPELSCAG
jgi:hypothetical protein